MLPEIRAMSEGRGGYILDKDRAEALRRLQGIERLEDPATVACLEEIGVAPGWHCLEAGAGAGSIARWLDARAGPGGLVVAADLQVDILRSVGVGRAEIRAIDLAADPIESSSFDLVHARNLLVHIPSRDDVVAKLAAAVRPGGWIFLEEPDLIADGPDGAAAPAKRELYAKGTAAVFDFVKGAGLDIHFGGRLRGALHALGFHPVRAEGIATVFQGGHLDHRSPHGAAFAEIKGPVVAAGAITAADYDAFLALYDDPAFAWREGLRMMVRARRP
jgi:2-polyprenyl-3-methyl-5-hydroxy-6-metoxy-1,4-benzoquinol methylase